MPVSSSRESGIRSVPRGILGGSRLIRTVPVDVLQHIFGTLVTQDDGDQFLADFHPLGIDILDTGLVHGAMVRIGRIESGDFGGVGILRRREGQGVELRNFLDLVLNVFRLGEEGQILLRGVTCSAPGCQAGA